MTNQTKITDYYSPEVEQMKEIHTTEFFTLQDELEYINKLTEEERMNYARGTTFALKLKYKLYNTQILKKCEYQQRQHYLKHRELLIDYRKSLKQSLICEKNFKEQKPKVVKKKPKVIKKKKMKATTLRKIIKYLKYEEDMKTFKYEQEFVVDAEATITGLYKMTLIYDKAPEKPTDEELDEYNKIYNLQ